MMMMIDYDYPVVDHMLGDCHDGIAVPLHLLTQYDLNH